MGRKSTKGWLHPHEVLLETDLLVVVGGKEDRYTVTLTQERIILNSGGGRGCFKNNKNQFSILSRDIVSVRPPQQEGKAKKKKNGKSKRGKYPVFMIVAFPCNKSGTLREKQSYFFQLPRVARREEVIQTTRVWVEAISEVCMGRTPDMLQVKPPLLILINPMSGKGQGQVVWQKAVDVLKEAGVIWEVVLTEGPGHAREIMATLELAAWSGVVIVSGDGLVHEVYNGLMSRPDWRSALEFSVGVIPAGSGNALTHSLLHWQGEKPEADVGLMSMALSIARGNLAPMDLFVIRGPANDMRIGFLSLGWGLITDVDVDSEGLRWMGSVRFTIYGLLKVAKRRLYRGTISYILADWPDKRTTTIQVPIHPLDSEESDWTNSSLDAPQSMLAYPKKITSSLLAPQSLVNNPAPHSLPPPLKIGPAYAQSWQELDERLCTVSFVNREAGLREPIHRNSAMHNNSFHRESVSPQRKHSKSSKHSQRMSSTSPQRETLSPDRESRSLSKSVGTGNGIKKNGRNKNISTTPTSPTPTGIPPAAPPPVYPPGREPSPITDPVSHPLTATPLHKDWVTETSDYLTVMLLNLPYLDRTFFGAPDCTPDDEVLWLMIVRPSVTRISLINFMVSIESGRHVDMPGVDLFPVTAAKITPDTTGPMSNMAIDGECIPAGPVQAHILPGAARVMVK